MSNRDFGNVQSDFVLKATLNLHPIWILLHFFQSRQGHFAGLISFSIATAVTGMITAVTMPVDATLSEFMLHPHEVQHTAKDNLMDECDPSEREDGKMVWHNCYGRVEEYWPNRQGKKKEQNCNL